MSHETIKRPTTSDSSLAPALGYYATKTRVKFTKSFLKQDKITYTHEKAVSIDIVYELNFSDANNNYPTIENPLFGAIRLITNILVVVMDLIEKEPFLFLVVD